MAFIETEEVNEAVIDVWEGETTATAPVVLRSRVEGVTVPETGEVNEVATDVWGDETTALVVLRSWLEGVTVPGTGEVNEVAIDVWGDEPMTEIMTEEVWIIGVLFDTFDELWVWITAELLASEEVGWLSIAEDTDDTAVCTDLVKSLDGDEVATTVEVPATSKTKRTIKG